MQRPSRRSTNSKTKVGFDWQVGEEAFQQRPAVREQINEPYGRFFSLRQRQFISQFLWSFLVFIAAWFLGTSGTLSPHQSAQQQVVIGVQDAITNEEITQINPQIDISWLRTWSSEWNPDTYTPEDRGPQILQAQTEGDLVRVTLLMERPSAEWWLSGPYRETRFYRESELGWQRTEPSSPFWKLPLFYNLHHLRFEYYRPDETTIRTIARQLEQAYVELHKTLGLTLPSNPHRITIAFLPQRTRQGFVDSQRIELTSPTLARIPDHLTDAEYLSHTVMSWLILRAVNQIVEQESDGPRSARWEMALWGVRSWLRADLLGQRQPDHEQLDATLWPLLQQNLDLEPSSVSGWRNELYSEQDCFLAQMEEAESIIAYFMDTYGRQRLPELVGEFRKYPSWEALAIGLYQHEPGFNTPQNSIVASAYTCTQ